MSPSSTLVSTISSTPGPKCVDGRSSPRSAWLVQRRHHRVEGFLGPCVPLNQSPSLSRQRLRQAHPVPRPLFDAIGGTARRPAARACRDAAVAR